jgi:hypothetical protein
VLDDVIADDAIEGILPVGKRCHLTSAEVSLSYEVRHKVQGFFGGITTMHFETAVNKNRGMTTGTAPQV